LAVGLTWPKDPSLSTLRALSLVVGLLVLIECGLNLSPVFVKFGETDYIRTHYGAIQRSLYFTFYPWLAYLSITLFRWSASEKSARRASASGTQATAS
jgi:hypothetical protein